MRNDCNALPLLVAGLTLLSNVGLADARNCENTSCVHIFWLFLCNFISRDTHTQTWPGMPPPLYRGSHRNCGFHRQVVLSDSLSLVGGSSTTVILHLLGVVACFLILALIVRRRRRDSQSNLAYTQGNVMGMQSMQYGGPPGYYPEQSQPLIQGQLQPPYEQPQYPTPAHNPYEPHAGFAPVSHHRILQFVGVRLNGRYNTAIPSSSPAIQPARGTADKESSVILCPLFLSVVECVVHRQRLSRRT